MIDKPVRVTTRSVGRRTIRMDQPAGPPAEVPVTPEHPSWLERLRKAILADQKDLRSSKRHRAIQREIWVGWWTDDEFGAINGSLENISRGGALILLNARPPKKQPIWIYKEIQEAMTCVRAEIVGVFPAPQGSYAARFRFEAPCPADLEKSAISIGQVSRKGPPRGMIGGNELTY